MTGVTRPRRSRAEPAHKRPRSLSDGGKTVHAPYESRPRDQAAVDPKRLSSRFGLVGQCLAEPFLVHAPEGVLRTVDEYHRDLLPVQIVQL